MSERTTIKKKSKPAPRPVLKNKTVVGKKITASPSNSAKPGGGKAFRQFATGRQGADGRSTVLGQPSSTSNEPLSLIEKTHQAILSVNVFDIVNPPLPLEFGHFNPRPITDSGVNVLVNAFLTDDFNPFSESAMIPVVMIKDDLDPSCIQTSFILGPNAPLLVLSDGGKGRMSLQVAGGQHRRDAVLVARAKLQKKLTQVENKLSSKVSSTITMKATSSGQDQGSMGRGGGKENNNDNDNDNDNKQEKEKEMVKEKEIEKENEKENEKGKGKAKAGSEVVEDEEEEYDEAEWEELEGDPEADQDGEEYEEEEEEDNTVEGRSETNTTTTQPTSTVSLIMKGGVSEDEIHEMQEEIARLKKKMWQLSHWGIIVYDAALVHNDADLASHISRNRKFIQTPETDIEKFHHILRKINEYQKTKKEKELRSYIKSASETQEKGLSQILQNPHTLNILLGLFNLGPNFYMQTPLNKQWITTNLHSYGGGFIMEYIEESVAIWHGLFTGEQVHEFDVPMHGAYLKALACDDFVPSQAHRSHVSGTWNSLKKDGSKADMTLLTRQMMFDLGKRFTSRFVPANFAVCDDEGWYDLMHDYWVQVNSTFIGSLEQVSVSEPHVAMIKSTIVSKLEWLSTDHSLSHYMPLLPLVTPPILECIGQLFQRIREALMEFVSWVCPYALYFTWGNKDLTSPHDMSQYAIQVLKENESGEFNSHINALKAAKAFATFPFKFISLFHQLADDLDRIPITTRPHHAEQQISKNLETSFPIVTSKSAEVHKWMVMVRSKKGAKYINTLHPDYWVLNTRALKDWRSSDIRNSKRDSTRYALAAVVEDLVVKGYRRRLFKKSKAAAFLRRTFKEMLDPLCGNREVTWFPEKSGRICGYAYPDLIELDENVGKKAPEVNLKKLERSRSLAVEREQAIKALAKYFDGMQKHIYAKAKPKAMFLHDEIRDMFKYMEKTFSNNIHRQEAIEEEGNIDEADPNDDKYTADFDECIKLPYVPLSGWTNGQAGGSVNETDDSGDSEREREVRPKRNAGHTSRTRVKKGTGNNVAGTELESPPSVTTGGSSSTVTDTVQPSVPLVIENELDHHSRTPSGANPTTSSVNETLHQSSRLLSVERETLSVSKPPTPTSGEGLSSSAQPMEIDVTSPVSPLPESTLASPIEVDQHDEVSSQSHSTSKKRALSPNTTEFNGPQKVLVTEARREQRANPRRKARAN